MTINYNGGIHEVVLFKDGERYDKSNFPQLFNSIASVTAKVGNQSLGTIEVQITPSFEDGITILNSGLLGIGLTQKGQKPKTASGDASDKSVTSKPIEDTVATPKAGESSSDFAESIYPVLAVRFLYADQFDNDGTEASTPWYVGILNTPEVSFSASEISITMKAASNGVMASKFITTAKFENESIYDCITKLLEPYEIEITFDEDDSQTESLLQSETYSGISSEPAMMTVKNILLKVDCYFSLINGDDKQPANEIRIKSRKAVNEGKVDFTFVLYRQIDPANNVIPIYDLQIQSNGALFLPGGAFGSSQKGLDPTTKKIVKLEVNDKSNKTKGLTGSSAGMNKMVGSSGKVSGITNGLGTVSPDIDVSGDNIAITQRGTESNKDEIESKALTDGSLGLTYTITVPGLPRLRAIRLAQIIVGDNIKGISGLGQIYSVTHRTGSDGWVSEIDFKRQPGLVDGASIDKRDVEPLQRQTSGVSRSPTNIA